MLTFLVNLFIVVAILLLVAVLISNVFNWEGIYKFLNRDKTCRKCKYFALTPYQTNDWDSARGFCMRHTRPDAQSIDDVVIVRHNFNCGKFEVDEGDKSC